MPIPPNIGRLNIASTCFTPLLRSPPEPQPRSRTNRTGASPSGPRLKLEMLVQLDSGVAGAPSPRYLG
jgi:hypothetical protein